MIVKLMRHRSAVAASVVILTIGATVAGALIGRGHNKERIIPLSEGLVRPGRYVPSAPKGTHRCNDSDVRLSSTEAIGVSSVERLYGVDVHNVGRTICVLEGRPTIEVPRHASAAISVEDSSSVAIPLPPHVPAGFPRQGARFGLAPGATAHAGIAALGICQRRLDDTTVSVLATLPGGGKAVRLPISACGASGTALVLGPFAPPDQPVPATHPWPRAITLELPSSIERGQRLDYRARLKNIGRRAFHFPAGGNCPEFDQMLTGTVDNPSDLLNCRAMGTLQSQESAVFAMRLEPFPPPKPGRHTLVWHLDDGTAEGIIARKGLEIGT
jgi:hypothetical protein